MLVLSVCDVSDDGIVADYHMCAPTFTEPATCLECSDHSDRQSKNHQSPVVLLVVLVQVGGPFWTQATCEWLKSSLQFNLSRLVLL